MSRMMTLLAAAVVVMTVPLVGMVRDDLARMHRVEVMAASLPSPKGFGGLTATGGRFALAEAPANARFGLFVLHGATLPQEVATWNALQAALAPAAIDLVGTCEDAACTARLRRGDASPSFTVLYAAGFSHGRLLARLDADKGWLLCDRAGGIKGRYPVPRDVAEVPTLAQLVQKPAEGVPDAQARS